MKSTLRSISAVLGGVLVGVIGIAAIEGLSTLIYPLPAGFDSLNTEAMRAHIASLPVGAFLFVLAAWGLGSGVASWMAGRLAPTWPASHSFLAGGAVFGASVGNMVMIPHPVWFWVAAIAVITAGTYVGALLASGRR